MHFRQKTRGSGCRLLGALAILSEKVERHRRPIIDEYGLHVLDIATQFHIVYYTISANKHDKYSKNRKMMLGEVQKNLNFVRVERTASVGRAELAVATVALCGFLTISNHSLLVS